MMMTSYKRLIFKFIFALMMIFFSVALVELACRVMYKKVTTKSGRWAVSMATSESFLRYDAVDEEAEKPKYIPHPYLLYQATPNYKTAFGQQHNSLGYRQDEFEPVKKKGTIRILTLGGSTTYGGAVDLPQESWPSQLGVMLKAEFPRSNYEVINGAWESASSPEILSGWIYRHRFLEPDIVILNMGINDIWPVFLSKQYSPEYFYFRRAHSINQPGNFLSKWLKASYFVKTLYAAMYIREVDAYPFYQTLDPDLYESEQKSRAVSRRILATDNVGFRRNLEQLIKVIKIEKAKIYIVMEPAIPKEKFLAKIISREHPYGWMLGLEDAWLAGQNKNYETMTQLAIANNLPYLTMNSKDFKFEWFTDWYHVDRNGERQKALLIKKGMQNAGLLK